MSSLSSISSTLSGLNSSGIQFSGLATGLDTNKLIQGLVAIQQAQIDRLSNNQANVVKQQSAFKSIEAKLIDLQGQASKLGRTSGSIFDARTADSSNKDLVTAAASRNAAAGVYSFRVNQLAKANQIASQGFDSANATIQQGTVQLKVGDGATTTVTIDSTNNTVQGLADAINVANGDVTATLVNDGSAGTPFKLLLTSKKSGAANDIVVTNNLTSGSGTQPSLTTIVQAGQDATITIGSGPGALTIANATNQIDGAFNGVTLNLVAADPAKEVSINVANDTDGAKKAIQDFVGSFNDLIDLIHADTSFDAKSGNAGILLGNRAVGDIQNELSRVFSDVVPNVNGKANRLAALGITLTDDGKLDLDAGKLDQALNGQISGVSFNDIRRLFTLDGRSTNPGVQFVVASDKAKASTTPYQVEISQVAKRASLLASNTLGFPVSINSLNNTLIVTVDSKPPASIVLADGTYSASAIAQELQSKINANSLLSGAGVSVNIDGGNVRITSQSFGFASNVAVTGGTALATLGFAGTESGQGQDVVGKYIANGKEELAKGVGQLLAGDSANANTADLQVRVTLSDAQLNPTAPETDLTVTRGLASRLGQVLNKYLDPINGRLKTIDQTLQGSVDDIRKSIDRQNAALQVKQQNLIRQFAALEGTVAKLKSTGDFLTGQFASLNAIGKSSN